MQEFEVEVTIRGKMVLRIGNGENQSEKIEQHAQRLVNEAAGRLSSPLLIDWQVTRVTPLQKEGKE